MTAGDAGAVAPAVGEADDVYARAGARALLVCRAATGLYLLEVLLNLTRPRLGPNEASLTILEKLPDDSSSFGRLLSMPRAVFWLVLVGIVVGVVLQAVALFRPRTGRDATELLWLTVAALVGPFALIPLTVYFTYPLVTLACIPSTALVLWLLHNNCQRFARLPARVLLAAFGWGALVAAGFVRACTGLLFGLVYAHQAKGTEDDLQGLLRSQMRTLDFVTLHFGVLYQLTAAAGVLVLLILLRGRIVDLTTGLVLGAAVGLGIAFSDSVLFIKLFGSLGFINGSTPGFQYWIHQSIGLLGGPVTFGALAGAALGVAFQLRDRRQQLQVAGTGLLAAVGGYVGTENLAALFSKLAHRDLANGTVFDTLIVSPGLWLVTQTPFIALAAVLLVIARRTRAAAGARAMEDARASGIVGDIEAKILLDPGRRLWTLVTTWRTRGRPAAVALGRLQAAQLELVGSRWRPPGVEPGQREAERLNETKVPRLRQALADALDPGAS